MQIDYTSRDFAALKADLIALISERTGTAWDPTDYSDLGHVLVEAFAYMGDIMSHYLDRIANETNIDTAIQRSTLLSLANLYDYKPSGPTPATVEVTFTNVGSNTIDIPVGTQVMAPLSYGLYSQVFFETVDSAIALGVDNSITLTCKEGKTVNTDRPDLIDPTYNKPLPENLGTSDGTTGQTFTVADPGVIDNSITVYVGQGIAFTTWSYKDNLLEYGPGDHVFTTIRNDDGTLTILFGDGVNGTIPPAGQLISTTYRTSVGFAGNVKSLSISELTFIPGNLDPQATTYLNVTNASPAVGGADADNASQLKKKIKNSITTRRRAITLDDYAKLATLVPQVGKANANASVYSSVNLYLQTQDDGSAAPGYVEAIVTNAVGDGTNAVYTTQEAHGFSAGDTVNISGCTPVGYNKTGAVITAITTAAPYTFTIANTENGTYNGNKGPGLAIDLLPTSTWYQIESDVQAYLSDKIMVGTTVTIQPPTYVPIYLELSVGVSGSYKNADIKLSAYQALLGTGGVFSYDSNTFGAFIPMSAITTTISNVPGVVSVDITRLTTDSTSSTASSISLAGNEIAYLTPTNLVITATGGV